MEEHLYRAALGNTGKNLRGIRVNAEKLLAKSWGRCKIEVILEQPILELNRRQISAEGAAQVWNRLGKESRTAGQWLEIEVNMRENHQIQLSKT